jgi:hypothetical protein
MRLILHPSSRKSRVHPADLTDYMTFKKRFGLRERETELHLLEKFYAARLLAEEGFAETYVRANLRCIPYSPQSTYSSLIADVCGHEEGQLTVVFCETEPPAPQLRQSLEVVNAAENARAILLYPFTLDASVIEESFPNAVESGKLIIQRACWLNHGFEEAFKRALDLIDLLGNETRMKMLLPLLERPQGKKHFRARINPKLVYENLSSFLKRGLIDELPEDQYELTPLGERILCEYLTFLEKVKKALEEFEG